MKTTTLFGGVLLAAGMQANAQMFDFSPSTPYATTSISNAYPFGDGGSYNPYGYTSSETNYNVYTGTTTASTSGSTSNLRTSMSWDGTGLVGYGLAYTVVTQTFTVTEDADLIIDFDVTGVSVWTVFVAEVDIFGLTGLLSVDQTDGFGDVNTLTTTSGIFDAGTTYLVQFGFIDFAAGVGATTTNSTSESFVNLTLTPAPGAAVLAGMGGLVAARRRRA